MTLGSVHTGRSRRVRVYAKELKDDESLQVLLQSFSNRRRILFEFPLLLCRLRQRQFRSSKSNLVLPLLWFGETNLIVQTTCVICCGITIVTELLLRNYCYGITMIMS